MAAFPCGSLILDSVHPDYDVRGSTEVDGDGVEHGGGGISDGLPRSMDAYGGWKWDWALWASSLASSASTLVVEEEEPGDTTNVSRLLQV